MQERILRGRHALTTTALRSFSVSILLFLGFIPAWLLPIGSSGFLTFALAGTFVIFCHDRRRLCDIRDALALGAVFLAAYLLHGGSLRGYVGSYLGSAGAFAGLGSLVFLGILLLDAPGKERQHLKSTLLLGSLVPLLCGCSLLAVFAAVRWTPRTCDYNVYAFDRLLNLDTFLFGRWFVLSRPLFLVCAVAYNTLPLYVSTSLAIFRSHARLRAFSGMVLTLGIVGFFAYQICPCGGPHNRFGSLFPWALPSLTSLPAGPALLFPTPRNAMPSLHIGWVLLCYWNLRSVGRGIRIFAAVYLFLTALATLGTGEHYFVDLVVVSTLALAVHASWLQGAPVRARVVVSGAAASVTLFWLVSLRTGLALTSAPVAWLAVSVTLIGVALAERWLRTASLPDPAYENSHIRSSILPSGSEPVTL